MIKRCLVAAAMIGVVLSLYSGRAAILSNPSAISLVPIAVNPIPESATERPSAGTLGGEVQSTVVPPGKKAQCPQGCLLISNDAAKSPGKILRFGLDDLAALPAASATFDQWPWPTPSLADPDYQIASNDHDLITMNNGDVLYLRMGRTKAPLTPKPAWFSYAYKLSPSSPPWGPGARSVILVWRSEDGGESFYFVSSIDTATVDDDSGPLGDFSGGLPQNPSAPYPYPYPTLPGSPPPVIWSMGGTDGPLARVDAATDRVFAVIGLVGYLPDASRNHFAIDKTKPLKRSLVMMSSDHGQNWDRVGTLPFRGWRTDVVARAHDVLAFAAFAKTLPGNGESFVATATIGQFPVPDVDPPIDAVAAPEPQGEFGWDQSPWAHPVLWNAGKVQQGPTDSMDVNVAGQTILVRSPSSKKMLLAFMDTIEGGKGDGYRLYLYDGNNSWSAFPPIVPASPHTDNFILHLTAIDPGQGPILLYWYDVNTVTRKATIRGRLITADDKHTEDFAISSSFSVENNRWYGDYHTAGGYRRFQGAEIQTQYAIYHYYPVWNEPDGKTYFKSIRYVEPPPILTLQQVLPQQFRLFRLIPQYAVSPTATTLHRSQIDLSRLEIPDAEEDERNVLRPVGPPREP